eukprot:765629-Hanusia_phi.AAC.2
MESVQLMATRGEGSQEKKRREEREGVEWQLRHRSTVEADAGAERRVSLRGGRVGKQEKKV